MKILVVEDDIVSRTLTVETLKSRYDDVDSVATAEQCLDCCSNYDMIIMDWNLPGMSGVEAAQEIKERYPGLLPVLVILTASYYENEDSTAYGCGVTHYMNKMDPDVGYKLIWNARLVEKKILSKIKG